MKQVSKKPLRDSPLLLTPTHNLNNTLQQNIIMIIL